MHFSVLSVVIVPLNLIDGKHLVITENGKMLLCLFVWVVFV